MRLIKEQMFKINPRIGIANLHIGLSPYIKGCANWTNWCIATKQFHLIGNIVMWIDKGIDSGNLLFTELTLLSGYENLCELHFKVMEHAHKLYIKAIDFLINGKIQSIPQNQIEEGKIYLTKDWTLKQKIGIIKNFTQFK